MEGNISTGISVQAVVSVLPQAVKDNSDDFCNYDTKIHSKSLSAMKILLIV